MFSKVKKPAVYICESGTTADGWDYRKYSDGRYEAYMERTENTGSFSSSSVGYYSKGFSVPTPSDAVSGSTAVTLLPIAVSETDGNIWLWFGTGSDGYRYASTTTVAKTRAVRFNFIGRWK